MKDLRLGDLNLSFVSDGTYFLDGGAFFGVVPKALWSRKAQPDDQNRVVIGLNSVVIRGGGKTILIETGIGNKLGEKLQKIYGNKAQLVDNLRAAGIDPAKIDIVINSHLHFDHCGWNTTRSDDGKVAPTFPNATYYAPAEEVEVGHLQRERDAVSYISDNYDPLIRSGQMKLVRGGEQIETGIWVENLPGHTRGMMAVHIESQGKHACYISDLMPTTWHLEPTWLMAFDLYPLETIENKKRFIAKAVPEQWTVIFTHDASIPAATLEKDALGRLVARPIT